MSASTPGLRIGTRGSTLALAQANSVAAAIGGDCEIVTVRTRDEADAGDKSRFTGEIERALAEDGVDIAVHSAKDLPTDTHEGLTIAAVPERESAADAWVGAGDTLDDAPEGATVGTASLRRRAQLLAARPDLRVAELRGNVDTRLRRVADGDFDAAVLAVAGLTRLGRGDAAAFELLGETMVPAAGQGCLALQARSGDDAAMAALAPLDHAPSHRALECERAAVAELGADCDTPVGVHAAADGPDRISVRGWCGLPDGSEWLADELEGDGDPAELGRELARRMLSAGAREILARATRPAAGEGA